MANNDVQDDAAATATIYQSPKATINYSVKHKQSMFMWEIPELSLSLWSCVSVCAYTLYTITTSWPFRLMQTRIKNRPIKRDYCCYDFNYCAVIVLLLPLLGQLFLFVCSRCLYLLFSAFLRALSRSLSGSINETYSVIFVFPVVRLVLSCYFFLRPHTFF